MECIDKLFDHVVKHQEHSENIVEIMNQYGSLCDQFFLPERLRQYVIGGDSKMLPKVKISQRVKMVQRTRDKYLFLQVLENPQNIRWMERVANDYLMDKDMFKRLLGEIDGTDKVFEERPASDKTHFRETSFFNKEERNKETRGMRDISLNNHCNALMMIYV